MPGLARICAGTSPITRASGTKRVVLARYVRNMRLADAIYQWSFASLSASPGARAFYDAHREAGATHHAALRALGNRWVGILHGCLTHQTPYAEKAAWAHRPEAEITRAARHLGAVGHLGMSDGQRCAICHPLLQPGVAARGDLRAGASGAPTTLAPCHRTPTIPSSTSADAPRPPGVWWRPPRPPSATMRSGRRRPGRRARRADPGGQRRRRRPGRGRRGGRRRRSTGCA